MIFFHSPFYEAKILSERLRMVIFAEIEGFWRKRKVGLDLVSVRQTLP